METITAAPLSDKIFVYDAHDLYQLIISVVDPKFVPESAAARGTSATAGIGGAALPPSVSYGRLWGAIQVPCAVSTVSRHPVCVLVTSYLEFLTQGFPFYE